MLSAPGPIDEVAAMKRRRKLADPAFVKVPIEARFHVNPQGFPDLLAGEVTPDQFLRKLRRPKP